MAWKGFSQTVTRKVTRISGSQVKFFGAYISVVQLGITTSLESLKSFRRENRASVSGLCSAPFFAGVFSKFLSVVNDAERFLRIKLKVKVKFFKRCVCEI